MPDNRDKSKCIFQINPNDKKRMFASIIKFQLYCRSENSNAVILTIYLLVTSADNLCKKFDPRPGPNVEPDPDLNCLIL